MDHLVKESLYSDDVRENDGKEHIGPRVEEVTYGRRRLNNKKLYDMPFCRQTKEGGENYIQDFGGKS